METRERAVIGGSGRSTTDVAGLPAARLEAEILTLAERLAAGTYELLVLVGELDARGTWAAWGALSCAAWLADACDVEVGTARTQVRVARALRAHRCSMRRCGPGRCPTARPGCWSRT